MAHFPHERKEIIEIFSTRLIYVHLNTAFNTVILSNFLVCEFCGKAQFPQCFGQIAKFEQREIMVFYAVRATADESFIS